MNKATILIIGENNDRHAALVENSGNRFYTLTAHSEETAIDRFLQSRVDAVVFGKDVVAAVRSKLEKLFSTQQPGVAFTEDDNSNGMIEKISAVIARQQEENKPSFSFKDDALKNAGLNIEIQ